VKIKQQSKKESIMTRTTVWAVTAAAILMQSVCSAQAGRELLRENEELRARVGTLEKQMSELQKEEAADKEPLWSTLDIQFYGYVKADASYDNSRVTSGNFVLYVDPEIPNNNDNEFNLTANQTRLGFNITGPASGQLKTSGRVEFDFFGNYAAENKPKIHMRHAYMTLDWLDCGFSLLAGQAWDVISPLVPYTLNYTVLWNAGNIGYRRPQIRATKRIPLNDQRTLTLQGAMVRTIGRTSNDPTGSESGEDAGFPTLQGRVALTTPFLSAGPTTLGLSGHWGEEEYDLDATGANTRLETWSINLDVTQPLASYVSLKGELFCGENLNAYFGGIGQGVNTSNPGDPTEIDSSGGWFAVNVKPQGKWTYNVGAGLDDVDAADVSAGQRTANSAVFGNAIYAFNQHADVGFELSHWRTHYKDPSHVADDLRLQLSFIYKF
jgi:hypothetical protein